MYTGGDQVGYHTVYNLISGLGFGDNWTDIHSLYLSRISGDELIHFLVILIGGGLDINKNFMMSFFNGVLAFYSIRLFLFWGGNLWVAVALILTNYYFYVLYFAAERLKFAILFLVLSLQFIRKPIWFAINILLSIYSHFSVIAIYSGIYLYHFFGEIKLKNRDFKMGIFLIILLFLFFIINSEYLLWKLDTYIQMRERSFFNKFFPLFSIFLLSLIYAKNKLDVVLLYLPLIICIAIIDGSRFNMLAFFIFLFFGFKIRGGLNIGMMTMMIYFFCKSVIFVISIARYGQGFGA
jgi:hypothetical protein